jgi:hypothetical protein
MNLLVVLATTVALTQAPPATKAEQLQDASRKGDAAAVKQLLDEGVDVNTKFRYGATAIFYACDAGNVEVVKVLLDKGAALDIEDTFYKFTPLMLAVSPARKKTPAHTEIVKLLIAKGAPGRENVLAIAVGDGDADTVKAILDAGPLPASNLTDALEAAKAENKTAVVALLEKSGAKPYEDFKIDPALLARYAGTYRLPNGNEIVITTAGGRLIGAPAGGSKAMLSPRDSTTFLLIGQPGATLTFKVEADKVTAFTLAQTGRPSLTYARVEGK